MSEERVKLFVYGTLKPGFSNYRSIERFVVETQPGEISGVLLDLGSFPALIQGPGIVRGVLLTLHAEALTVTDRIEGYDPSRTHNLYIRTEVEVRLASDETVKAWTYYFAFPDQIHHRRECRIETKEGSVVYAWPVFDEWESVVFRLR